MSIPQVKSLYESSAHINQPCAPGSVSANPLSLALANITGAARKLVGALLSPMLQYPWALWWSLHMPPCMEDSSGSPYAPTSTLCSEWSPLRCHVPAIILVRLPCGVSKEDTHILFPLPHS